MNTLKFSLALGYFLVATCLMAQVHTTDSSKISTTIDPSKIKTSINPKYLAPLSKRTLYTDGKKLRDLCGAEIVLKGVNKMVVFDNIDSEGVLSFAEIAKTGANCVRIAWGIQRGSVISDDVQLDRIITNAKNNGLIPIVGLWDYMDADDGGFSRLQEYVNYWKRPVMVQLIRKHRAYLIVNIGNEAAGGDENNPSDLDMYANAYKDAIVQIRNVGVTVPLMIDGMDRGKSLHCFAVKGVEILNADRIRNIIFDFHPYWPKNYTDVLEGGSFIVNKFNEIRTVPINIVMGEIAKYGAYAGATVNPCSDAGLVDYAQLIRQADAQNIGWLVWEWGPGNQWQVAGDCPELDMTTDRTYASLAATTDPRRLWSREVGIDAPNSIKNTALKTPFMRSGFRRCRP